MNYRRYPFSGISNFRDLGGYPVKGGGMTRYGVFFRCAHLGNSTAEDRGLLRDLAVRKIVDLRCPEDLVRVPDRVDPLGPPVVNVSLWGELRAEELDVVSTEKDTLTLKGMYRQIIERSPDRILEALEELALPEGAAVFHCFNGKDRTGIMAMFLLSMAGVEDCDIIADYEVSHTYIEGFTEDISGSHYENMKWLLGYLEREFGSPVGYLRSCGLSPQLEHRIAERFVEPDHQK